MSEKLRHVNAVLLKLSQDEDLQDDFKLPVVQAAIDHWTNRKRLDVEQAQKLQNNRRVVYVLQQFQMLQSVCQQAGMPVPLDHLLTRKTEVDPSLVQQYFKDESNKAGNTAEVVRSEAKRENKEKKDVSVPQGKSEPGQTPVAARTDSSTVGKPAEILTEQSEIKSADPIPVIAHVDANTGVNVNDVLRFFIALTVVMIAVVLSQLWK